MTADAERTERPPPVEWRGVHHLALVTSDMDATTRFWHGVLDARLVVTLATDAFRHYFFQVAPGMTVAFFEYRGAEVEAFAKPAGVPFPLAAQFDHLSLGVADEDALLRLAERLAAFGCEVTEVVDHGILRSIYFNDPNGIALEASWWTADATEAPTDLGDRRFFSDPDPVPAVRELMETGNLASTPRTALVDEVTRDIYKPPATD